MESYFGNFLFGIIFLICGLAGTALHYAFNINSAVPCIGASGAISGIAGCYFILFPTSNFDLDIYLGYWRVKTIPTRTYGAVGAWIAEQAILAIITQAVHASSVAYWAHIGGFIAGVALAFSLRGFFDSSGHDNAISTQELAKAASGK